MIWVWDDTQSSTTKSQALDAMKVAHSCRQVTVCVEFLTIAIWIEVPNSHLISGSLRGWLLAAGDGRRKSTAKSGSASKWHSIWMHCLRVDAGSKAHNGTPGRIPRQCDVNSDEFGSSYHLMVGPRYTRASHDA